MAWHAEIEKIDVDGPQLEVGVHLWNDVEKLSRRFITNGRLSNLVPQVLRFLASRDAIVTTEISVGMPLDLSPEVVVVPEPTAEQLRLRAFVEAYTRLKQLQRGAAAGVLTADDPLIGKAREDVIAAFVPAEHLEAL